MSGWWGSAPMRRAGYGAVVDNVARLTVLGSLNMDISVTVPTLPGPGATVLGSAAAFAPGGKGANQAVAAARLGGEGLAVAMIGCVGDDDFGRTLRAALRAEGVDDRAVRTVADVPTGIAMITVDRSGENMITVSPGANHKVSAADVAPLADAPAAPAAPAATGTSAVPASPAAPVPAAGDVLVISAEVPIPVISAALAASAGRVLRVLNLAPAPPEAAELVAAGPDWLVVNESEAAAVLGRPVAGLADAADAAADLVKAGARNAVVTAGAAGAACCGPQPAGGDDDPLQAAAGDGQDRPVVRTIPGFKVQATDTVGAGDTFVGALAVALAGGVSPVEAVTAAAAAGAAAATRPGTQTGMPYPADVFAATGYRWPAP
jgi:ribokinase